MSLASLRILESKTIPVASPVSFGILNWKIIISLETGSHYQHRHCRSLIVGSGQDKTSQQLGTVIGHQTTACLTCLLSKTRTKLDSSDPRIM